MSSQKGSVLKPQKPLRFELWLRVECPDKECKTTKEGRNWTFIPAKNLPKVLLCVVCSKPISLVELAKSGVEWMRRGINTNG